MNETTQANASTGRRTFTVTTLVATLLALVALAVAGVGVLEYQRVRTNLAHDLEMLERQKAELAQVKYDDQGNVVDEDRERYIEAVTLIEIHTSGMKTAREQEPIAYPYMAGGLLAFVVFAFVAVRSTRKT